MLRGIKLSFVHLMKEIIGNLFFIKTNSLSDCKKDFEINSLIISDDGQALYFTTKANVEIDPLTNKPLIESDLIKIQHPYKILDNIRYEK